MSLTDYEVSIAKWVGRAIKEAGAGEAFKAAYESGDAETVRKFTEAYIDVVFKKIENMQTQLITIPGAKQKFTEFMYNFMLAKQAA